MPFELEGSMALDFLMKSFYYKIFLSYFIFERINILKIELVLIDKMRYNRDYESRI